MKDINKLINDILKEENFAEDTMNSRQTQIIEAAIHIFSEKGFDASRTIDIAKEANVAEGTIFRYFKTKKELLVGLLIPLITKVFKPIMFQSIENLMNNDQDLSIEEVLKKIYLDRLNLARKNMPLVKTVMVESIHHPEILSPLQQDLAPKIIPIIDEFFEKEKKNNTFRDIDTRVINRTFISLLIGYNILISLFPDMYQLEDEEKEIEAIVDILLNGVKKGGEVENG